jgi:hypothetical protein
VQFDHSHPHDHRRARRRRALRGPAGKPQTPNFSLLLYCSPAYS